MCIYLKSIMFKVLITILLLFILSCSNLNKKKSLTDQKVNSHTKILNDSVGEIIRIDSFKVKIKKEYNHNPIDSNKSK